MTGAGWRVLGEVQGVGYRAWVRSVGSELSLSGTVRNLADGSVVVHARGAESALSALEARLAVGPPLARVVRVERAPFAPQGVREGAFVTLR